MSARQRLGENSTRWRAFLVATTSGTRRTFESAQCPDKREFVRHIPEVPIPSWRGSLLSVQELPHGKLWKWSRPKAGKHMNSTNAVHLEFVWVTYDWDSNEVKNLQEALELVESLIRRGTHHDDFELVSAECSPSPWGQRWYWWKSGKGQDEVNNGAKWQATKIEELKTKGQVQAKLRCWCWVVFFFFEFGWTHVDRWRLLWRRCCLACVVGFPLFAGLICRDRTLVGIPAESAPFLYRNSMTCMLRFLQRNGLSLSASLSQRESSAILTTSKSECCLLPGSECFMCVFVSSYFPFFTLKGTLLGLLPSSILDVTDLFPDLIEPWICILLYHRSVFPDVVLSFFRPFHLSSSHPLFHQVPTLGNEPPS